jgi:hypothetical protein
MWEVKTEGMEQLGRQYEIKEQLLRGLIIALGDG